MKLTFLGAAHEVTGSCTLLEADGKKILIDCGMEQGKDTFVNQELPVSAGEIDLVLLTHAHIDHSGKIPLLVKQGFSGSIYTTEATSDLCRIMLMDSAHIQESEAAWRSKKAARAGKEPVEPLYDTMDAQRALSLLRPCAYGEKIRVSEGIEISFTDVGHLLGSAAISIFITENGITKTLVCSGDVGNTGQPLLRDPQQVKEADYLLLETTYAGRFHGKKPDYIALLTQYLQETFDRGGNVVIPSFAVGRTQEFLYFLRQIKEEGRIKGHDHFPVYVDSPLANEATSIFLQCDRDFFDEEARSLLDQGINPVWFPDLKTSITAEESKAINLDPTPKVILSASGMCEAGRIRHHLKHNLWRKESLILFVGYQAVGTLGRSLYEGAKSVKLFGESIAVNARIETMPGISGHADEKGLLQFLAGFTKKPELVFLNHGEDEACTAFCKTVEEAGFAKAVAPYSGSVYDLATGECLTETFGIPIIKKPTSTAKAERAFDLLLQAARKLLQAVQNCKGRTNAELKKFTKEIETLADKIEE